MSALHITIDEANLKTCTKCKQEKLADAFYAEHNYCKECQNEVTRGYHRDRLEENPSYYREKRLRTKYGITEEDYFEMLIAQKGKCAICESKVPGRGHKNFDIDHDQETGIVRGLLCSSCNLAIGGMRHSPDRLMSAAAYLLKYQNILVVVE